MSVRNMEERVMTVCSVCEIPREKSLLLLERHGWSCDYAITAYMIPHRIYSRYFEGELDRIESKKEDSRKRPLPVMEYFSQTKSERKVSFPEENIENIENIETLADIKNLDDSGEWPKHLPMFQVNALSLRSGHSIQTGTVLFLEAENKDLTIRRKAKVLTKNNNEELIARCRVYQKVGRLSNQRVIHLIVFMYSFSSLGLSRPH